MAFDGAFGQAPPSASVFCDDEKPLGPMAGSKEGLVMVSTPRYSKTEVSLGEEELTARVDIRATSSAALTRVGLDLVAVVDVSGSMKGDKIESAKRALLFVIGKLTPLDRLSIVTFSSSAQRVSRLRSMTEAAKKELIGTVASLRADGGMDINSGLVKGLEVLAGRVHRESRTGNIYLMSDGRNDGPSSGDARKVKPGDVGVYTFGFGAGTDHKLLTQLAKNSTGGTYSSLPDGASFALLLGGLATVVAQDVRLTLKHDKKRLNVEKMSVVEEAGSNYKQETDAAGNIIIFFGTVFSGEVRTVLVRFKLKTKNRNVTAKLAGVEHSYAAQESPQIARNLVVKRRKDNAGVDGCSVRDEELRRKHAQNMADACDMARANKLPEARNKLDDAMNDIEHIYEGGLRDRLRAELKKLLDCVDTQMRYDGPGNCCGITAIICHLCQRAAGRGQGKVGGVDDMYVTPRKKLATADDDDANDCNPLCAPITCILNRALKAIHKMLADAKQRRNNFC